MRERRHPQHEAEARVVVVPGLQHLVGELARARVLAGEEPAGLRQPQRHQVARPAARDDGIALARLARRAAQPGGGGAQVAALARRQRDALERRQ
ncbi:MAG: hypothetical protein U1F06_06125 [Steroidobacteraceae bacterium]